MVFTDTKSLVVLILENKETLVFRREAFLSTS